MKLYLSFVATALGALRVAAGPVEKISPVCKGGVAHAVSSKQIGSGKIDLVEYNCTQGFAAEYSSGPVEPQGPATKLEPKSSLELEARQRGLCQTYAPPTCQSGVFCPNDVCNPTNALIPTEYDCNQISNALYAEPGTFIANPLTYYELKYGTCVMRWANNQSSGVIEYSFYDWGSNGDIVYNNCIRVNSGLKRNGGYCTPYSYAYWVQTTYVTFGLPS